MIPTDDPLLSGLRYLAHDAPDYGTAPYLRIRDVPDKAPSILSDDARRDYIDDVRTSAHYALLAGAKEVPDAVAAITDGRVDAFLAANPIPRADWSLAAYKPPLHPLDGIRFNLAEPA